MSESKDVEGPIVLSGYLNKMKMKQSKILPVWNKRWFALQGHHLSYYQSKTSTKPSTVIDIYDFESVRQFEKGDNGVFSFVIKVPERSYFLRTETLGDMQRWVRGLQEQRELWIKKRESKSHAMDKHRPKHFRDDKPVTKNASSDADNSLSEWSDSSSRQFKTQAKESEAFDDSDDDKMQPK